MRTPKEFTSLTAQSNYITYIVFKLKAELAKIKDELNEIRKELSETHFSLTNEMRRSGNSDLGTSSPFQRKFPFQNLKTTNSFPSKKLKSKKKFRDHLKHIALHIFIFNPNP